MWALHKYYPYFDDEGKLIDKLMNEDGEVIDEYPDEGELVFGCEYFEFLDNYYRYGIGFDPIINLQDENKLYIKCFYDKGWNDDKADKDKYYILNNYRWSLKQLLLMM